MPIIQRYGDVYIMFSGRWTGAQLTLLALLLVVLAVSGVTLNLTLENHHLLSLLTVR